MNLTFSLIYGACSLILVVTELIGVKRKQKGDTITENWHFVDKHLNGPTRWFWRVLTVGFLAWIALHFGGNWG